MKLNFEVVNQKLTLVNHEVLANKSHNTIECNFKFVGNDWNGKEKFVIFKDEDYRAYQLYIDNNTVFVPEQILCGNVFNLTVYGSDNNSRITTNYLRLDLVESDYTVDIEDLKDYEVDIWSQIFSAINDRIKYTDIDTLNGNPVSKGYMKIELDKKSDIGHIHLLSDIRDFPVLSDVALTGKYNDLKGKPVIPFRISDLIDDSNFVKMNVLNNILNDYPTYLVLNSFLNSKVDKVNGKSLSSNDYTNNDKNKLNSVEYGANKISKTSQLVNDSNFLTEHQDISGKINYTDIIDNLNSNDSNKVLSAKQGKKLADLIGNIQLYVNR